MGWKFIPFSPRWLLQQDRRDEAFNVVCRLHRTPEDPQNIKAREELMEKQFELDQSMTIRRFEIFRTALD
jgi:hypothetical protein